MKTKGDVIYLTEKEWNAFKEQEHQERLALSTRVARRCFRRRSDSAMRAS